MTRASSCHGLLDERQRKSQWRAHRARISCIQSSSAVSVQALSSALAASAHPHRIHPCRHAVFPTRHRLEPKHHMREHLARLHQLITANPALFHHENEINTIVVPSPIHTCLHHMPKTVPSASSHALYTRRSATMKNNFVESNASTMQHAMNGTLAASRVRVRAQSTILHENKILTERLRTTRSTIDPIALKRHEEMHFRMRGIRSRHRAFKKT